MTELIAWGVKTTTFIPGKAGVVVPSGPYVIASGNTWQPWRIYYDFTACFMTTFKPPPREGAR